MMKKNVAEKCKILLGIAGIVTAIVVFYYTILSPGQSLIADLSAALTAERRQVAIISKFAGEHPDIARYEQQVDSRLAVVNQLLPDQADMSTFTLAIERAAAMSGLKLNSIKPGPLFQRQGYSEIPVELTVSGTYFQMVDFLSSLEQVPRYYSGHSMTIQSQHARLTGTFKIIVYYADE